MSVVLIVEDDDDLRESLAEVLTLRGFDAVAAANGREALDMLKAGLSPCLILLDLMLPVMSGWEFRELQRANPIISQIPTVVISGINNPEKEAATLGAAGFVPKPINLDLLYETLAQHC